MRALLALVALALVALLVILLGESGDRGPERVDAIVERSDDSEGADETVPTAEIADVGRSPADVSGANLNATRRSPGDGPVAETWEVVGRLVSLPGDEPLIGYTVALARAGRVHRGAVRESLLLETDENGEFRAEGLRGRGPWDVYAWPFDPLRRVESWSVRAGVGSLVAAPAGEAEPQVLKVRVGPRVVLRSPRPSGVDPTDLILEARGRISPFSSQTGRAGGFARASLDAQGFCEARLRPVRNPVQDERFGVRAVTRDGLWSVAEVKGGRLRNDTEAMIDRTLEPRGIVRFRVELEDPDGPADLDAATAFVGWHLPLGDPGRDQLDLPPQMATVERNRPMVRRADGTLEIHDLPVGPVELRTRRTGRYREGEPRYEVALPIPTTAVHGDPDPVVVRLRLVR